MLRQRTCPMILCAECGERITNSHSAMVVWSGKIEYVEEHAFAPVLLHKGDCDRRYEVKHGYQLWIELDAFLVQLLNNVGIKTVKEFAAIRKRETDFQAIG